MAGKPKKNDNKNEKMVDDKLVNNELIDIETLKKELKKELIKELRKEIEDEIEGEKIVTVEDNKEKPKKFRKIDRDEYVEVMNYTPSELIYVNERTQQQWNFSKFGDTDTMPYGELVTMKTTQPKFLYKPWLIPLNEDVIKQLGLSSVIDKIIKVSEIKKFYTLSIEEMDKFIDDLNDNSKNLLYQITLEKVNHGEFTDLTKIKFLQTKFEKDLIFD